MKSKTLLLIVFSFFVFQIGTSQNCFPTSADSVTWNVLDCHYGIGYTCNTLTYQYDYDTLYCGHVYSKIKAKTTGAIGYIRSDSSHAYIRMTNSCSDKEYLLYDFSITAGDTFYLANSIWNSNANDTTRFVLDSLLPIYYNGVERLVYYVKYVPNPDLWPNWFSGQMIWIKGIGSTTNPFFPIECIQDYCESSLRLLCFDSLGVQLYQDSVFKTCDTTYSDVGINEFVNKIQLIIYPIPFTKSLTVSVENATISKIDILNIHGELICVIDGIEKNNLRLDALGKLPEGIYFIKVQTDKGILTKKIIKME